jgi:hypothetical protein
MSRSKRNPPTRLEDLPNIGRSIAADLRRVGILEPGQPAEREPLAVFRDLAGAMGPRQDPCVLYTLLSAQHVLRCGEALPWWAFATEGKRLLEGSQWGIRP